MFGGDDKAVGTIYTPPDRSGLFPGLNALFEPDILHPVHSPTARRDLAMAFLPANGNRPADLTILFGGFGGSPTSVNKDDTWG